MRKDVSASEGTASPRSTRRDSQRYAIEVDSLLRVTAIGESKTYQSRTKDLSTGGACIVVERGIGDLPDRLRSPESQVLVALELHRDKDKIKTAALPVWIRSTTDWIESPPDGESHLAIGLSFVNMGKAEAEEIRSFLEGKSGPTI